MAMNGSAVVSEDSAIQEAFSKLSELEKDFAAVELDARMSFIPCLHRYAASTMAVSPDLNLRMPSQTTSRALLIRSCSSTERVLLP